MSDSVELVLDAKATWGEGPVGGGQKDVLYWVDIPKQEVHIFDLSTLEDRAINVGQSIGTVVPRKAGGVMLGLHHGLASLDLETEKLEIIHDPESDLPNNRFNDGKCDPAGRFWAGTLDMDNRPEAGSLYCMDQDLSVRRMLEKVTCSNGIAWSLDHSTMYYIDTVTHKIEAFDYDLETGTISNRRPAITVPEEMGHPDGMTIDAEGMLWVALCLGGCVARWDPASGKLLQKIAVPVKTVTACAFAGPNLDELYMTTGRKHLDENALRELPFAGGIFRATLGVCGIRAYEFAG